MHGGRSDAALPTLLDAIAGWGARHRLVSDVSLVGFLAVLTRWDAVAAAVAVQVGAVLVVLGLIMLAGPVGFRPGSRCLYQGLQTRPRYSRIRRV